VAIFKLHGPVESVAKVRQGLEKLRGALFQRPPLISAVKRQLRVRTVYDSKLLDYDETRNMGKSSNQKVTTTGASTSLSWNKAEAYRATYMKKYSKILVFAMANAQFYW